MSVQIKCDDAEFQATLREYMRHTSRALPSALNEKMFYIAYIASSNTPKNEKSKVESELNVIGYELKLNKKKTRFLRSKKTGRLRTGAAILGGPLIYRILNSRRTFAGKPGLKRAEMKEKARKFMAARFRSVGTLKAGWWNALTILGNAIGKPARFARTMNRLKSPSTVRLAKDGWSPKVEMEYRLQSKDPQYQRRIDQRVQDAVAAAFRNEIASMRKYITNKISGAHKNAEKAVPSRTSNLAAILKKNAP